MDKRLLFIAYNSAPLNKSASRRTGKLFKYLSRLGWKITLLTASVNIHSSPDEIDNDLLIDLTGTSLESRIIRIADPLRSVQSYLSFNAQSGSLRASVEKTNGFSFRSHVKKFFRKHAFFPDDHFLWLAKSYQTIKPFCLRQSFDAMLSTYGPASVHVLGLQINKKFGIPWVADFRDLWVDNIYKYRSGLLKAFDRRCEQRVLNNADKIIGVTDGIVSILKNKVDPSKVIRITNGYDPDDFSSSCSLRRLKKLIFFYAGGIVKPKRQDSMNFFFSALRALQNKNKIDLENAEIRYMGGDGDTFTKIAEQNKLYGVTKDFGYRPFSEVIRQMAGSHVLLLFQNCSIGATSEYPGKIFEYLGAKRPVLFIGNKSAGVKAIIKEAKCGWCLCPDENEAIMQLVKRLFDDHIKHKHIGLDDLEIGNAEQFSYAKLASNLSNILEERQVK